MMIVLKLVFFSSNYLISIQIIILRDDDDDEDEDDHTEMIFYVVKYKKNAYFSCNCKKEKEVKIIIGKLKKKKNDERGI